MISLTLLLTTTTPIDKNGKFHFSKELDIEFLEKNYSENLELAYSIFDHFNQNIEEEMTALQVCMDNKDCDTAKSILHKIKNNFIYVGASALSPLLLKMEIEAKEKNINIIETFKIFKSDCKKIVTITNSQCQLLKAFLDNKP